MPILNLNVLDKNLKINYFDNGKADTPIIFLHGLCDNASKFSNIWDQFDILDHRKIVFDRPGHGKSSIWNKNSVEDYLIIMENFIDTLNLNEFHIVGHSLGGLMGLIYANKFPQKVVSFVNIEGNLSGNDCGFSQYLCDMNLGKYRTDFEQNMTYRELSKSMIKVSNYGNLLDKFQILSVPKVFVYGEQSNIKYLDQLKKSNISVVKILNAGHAPFSDNLGEFSIFFADWFAKFS